jgi:alpha-galactosidase
MMVSFNHGLFVLLLLQGLIFLAHCKDYNPNTYHLRIPEGESVGASATNRVHVYVLAGQSDMEGHGEIDQKGKEGNQLNGTLLYQLQDPRTKQEFQILWDDTTNSWRTLSDVKIWFNEAGHYGGENGTNIPGVNGQDYSAGDLTVRYGVHGLFSRHYIGPELGFGFNVDTPTGSAGGDKILLLKTAWGGRSRDTYSIQNSTDQL